MKIEESAGSSSEVAPVPAQTVEAPQHDGGGLESTLAALSGIGGERLSQELNVVREASGTTEKPLVAPADIAKPNPDDTAATSSNIIKDVIAAKAPLEKPAESLEAPAEKPAGEIEKTDNTTVITSPVFGGNKPLGSEASVESTLDFDGSDIANKFIKEKTGHENLESLVIGSLNLQEKASGYDLAKKEADGYTEFFKNMPAELYEAVNSYSQGNDWKAEIASRPNLDFAKKSEDHSSQSLVDNYMPNEFSNDDWLEYKNEDCDLNLKKAMDIAVKTAGSNYENDRSKIENLQSDRVSQANIKNEAFSKSVGSSIDFLKKNVEGIDAGYVENLQKNLNINMITDMFLNSDGTLREEAALRAVMATDGHSMVEQYKVIAERQIENKERQEVLLRTPDKPKAKKGSAEKPGELNADLQSRLEQLNTGFEQKTVY